MYEKKIAELFRPYKNPNTTKNPTVHSAKFIDETRIFFFFFSSDLNA